MIQRILHSRHFLACLLSAATRIALYFLRVMAIRSASASLFQLLLRPLPLYNTLHRLFDPASGIYMFALKAGRQIRAGKLPPYPVLRKRTELPLVVGEVHHPRKQRPSEAPRWLVIPERGLFTGTAIVGAVGSGKTAAACALSPSRFWPIAPKTSTGASADSLRNSFNKMTAVSISSNFISQSSTASPIERQMPVDRASRTDNIDVPPVQATRKRGKRMSRRKGQNPKVRVGKRADGQKFFFFQYWIDLPGQEERKRQTEVIGPTSQMTKSEAARKKLEFISRLELNSSDYHIPSSRTFADAVSYYREVFAPRMLRASTFSVADGHLKAHLEADWKTMPVEHSKSDAVNEWIWKKREQRLSWVTIKNILRTMQRVLSASSKDKKPPFSQSGLAISERDKLQMKIDSRRKVSFSWAQAQQIAEYVGKIGPCKNVTAYRTVLLRDPEGRRAMQRLKGFLGTSVSSHALVFRSKRGGPLRETYVLNQCLHPAVTALGLKKAGLHAFRRGCNRRWELAGINPAVIRQQMGHTSSAMTARYTGEIPLEQIRIEFSTKFGNKIDILEKMENEVAVQVL